MSKNRHRSHRRRGMAEHEMWCSLGTHVTRKHPYLKEQFPGGTICMECQIKVVSNVETVMDLPAVTEAIYRRAQARHVEKRETAKMDARRKKAAPDSDGWVYYIRINGRIKIGYTANLRQRSRNYPPGSELVAIEPGTRELEKRRHEQFSRDLAQGREWFAESERLAAHITETAAQHGVPSSMMHAFTKHEGIKHVG